MHKWAMAALLIAASIMGIVYTIETIVIAERERVDEIVEDNELRFLAFNDQTFEKDAYTVEVGQTLKLTLRNESLRHGILIPDLDNGNDITIYENEPIEFTFTEPGEYDVICNIGCGEGHAAMVSKLIVVEASDQPDDETPEETAVVQ